MMHEGRIAAQGTEADLAASLLSHRSLVVEVRGAADVLQAALARVPEAREVRIEAHGELVRASIRVDDWAREQVSRAIVEAGLGLVSMQAESSGLESVFLKLSQQAGLGASSPSLPPQPPLDASAGQVSP